MFKQHTKLEKFGEKVFSVLVENFSQTFFVGGTVRDLLLKKRTVDIDIATVARPEQVIKLLQKAGIICDSKYKKFGVVIAKHKNLLVEITTLRADLPSQNRYPKVRFISSPKLDSQRRDFTINSLYFSQKTKKILDFHNGLNDLEHKIIRFVGNPKIRIKEDPLRIIRALRFALTLDFTIEKKSLGAIKKDFNLTKKLTQTKIKKELNKISGKKIKLLVKNILDNKKILDKYFK